MPLAGCFRASDCNDGRKNLWQRAPWFAVHVQDGPAAVLVAYLNNTATVTHSTVLDLQHPLGA